MILLVLWCVAMFLWLLANLPPAAQFIPPAAGGWLAFIAVLLLGLAIFKVL